MKIKKKWMVLLLPLLFQLSCNKFLDVTANNQIIQEGLFKNGDGIRIAVNGVYRALSSTDLYGKNLSWGFISALGGNYEINSSLPFEIRMAADFQWGNTSVIRTTEQIWSKSYNIIANLNNILQEVETKESSFFEKGDVEKNMILGEMYGIRAMLHFELMRLFTPAPITGFKGNAIPYVTKYPDHQPAIKDVDAVYSSIVEDMEKSKTLLAPIDTIEFRDLIKTFKRRIRQNGTFIPEGAKEFFSYRAQRMNFFSATALLARVYLYKKDYDNAYKNAKIVYDYQKKGWFLWTAAIYQGQISDIDYIYTKRPEELLLAFSNNRNYDNYEPLIAQSVFGNNTFRMSGMDILFENDFDDFRRVGWYNRYGDNRYLTWIRPRGTSSNATSLIENQGPLLPIVRFSEVYHILIECLNERGQTPEAVDVLNDLRINRGAKRKISRSISSSDLQEDLVNDIIRETLTEGQTFFMFKRLNRNIFYGANSRVMNPKDWVVPIPPSETAYQ